jgi:hypothetical protein
VTRSKSQKKPADKGLYLDKLTSRKVKETTDQIISNIPDNFSAWIAHYLQFAVTGM